MKSIQTKFLFLILTGVVLSAVILGSFSIMYAIEAVESESGNLMNLKCYEQAKEIDEQLDSIEQSVGTIASYAESELMSVNILATDKGYRETYTQELEQLSLSIVKNTKGALAVYVRYNPEMMPPQEGFLYERVSKGGNFQYQETTDLSKYDETDLEYVNWYYTPVKNQKPTWLQPYYNENLDIRMISYVIPLYKGGELFGVVGIDIDFEEMVEEIKNMTVYDTGYAILMDGEGRMVYHKYYEDNEQFPLSVSDTNEFNKILEDGTTKEDLFSYTTTRGAKKLALRSLSNDMYLALTAPASEIDADKNSLVIRMVITSVLIGSIFSMAIVAVTRRMIRPLKELTQASEKIGNDDWDISLSCTSEDEIGILAKSFSHAVEHLKFTNSELERERKKEQDYLKQLQEANMAKSEFLGNMSHDIRTPINGIMGMTDIAIKRIDDKERVLDCLNKISDSSKHLCSLINDCLDMSKIEQGKEKLNHQEMDLMGILDTCSIIIENQLVDREIVFSKNFDIIHRYLVGDELHLRQVLINILGNATKFTPDGGMINFNVTEISSDENKAKYEFEIKDNGIGMSEEFKEHLYEEFAQEDAGTRTTYQGSGLGMAIAKKYIDLLSGTINVESQKNVGSRFVVTFEFDINNNEVVPKKNNEIKDLTGMKILLVEDNELNAEIVQCILESQNVEVEVAINGEHGYEAFKKSIPGHYDVILMDVMMPIMDGLEATRAIRTLEREDAKTIPIIAMTAHAYVEDEKKSMEAGMNEHLSKPVDTEKMLEVLGKYYKNS